MGQPHEYLLHQLDGVRLYAKLISRDDASADLLVERLLLEAIGLAETDPPDDPLLWLLELASAPAEASGIVEFHPKRAGPETLIAAIRDLPLDQRQALALIDILHIAPQAAARILHLDQAALLRCRTGARLALMRFLNKRREFRNARPPEAV